MQDLTEPLALPRQRSADGTPRRVGVEIEFGGMDEEAAAEIVQRILGGVMERHGQHSWEVAETDLGNLKVVLDTKFRDRTEALAQHALDALTGLVPIEIVTDPILPEDIAELEHLRQALAEAGATGSRAGMLLGFGVHFNPAVAGERLQDILPIAQAFAFLEDALRAEDPIDPSRRALPFVDPYPRSWLDALALPEATDWDLSNMIGSYLRETPSRNRALDLLPLFRHLDEAAVVEALGSGEKSISPRPAYHYRLPDCRIDEADWSLAYEWNRWVRVEMVAEDQAVLNRLADAWREYRSELTSTRSEWRERSKEIAGEAGW